MATIREKLANEVLKRWGADGEIQSKFPNPADFYAQERKVVDLTYFRPYRKIPNNILVFKGK